MSDTRAESSTRWGELIELQPQQVVQIALFGAGMGLVLWIAMALVRQVILMPLFCGDPTTDLCVNSAGTAGNVAIVIASVVGLLGLVRLGVYRPLLVVIAVAISFWGFGGWVASLPWFEAIAWSVLLGAIAYVLFAWLVRPRSFLPAIILVVVAVLIIRIAPML